MITVYTALFGDYAIRDTLRSPVTGCKARYVCFTDAETELAAPGWEITRVPLIEPPRLQARLYKTRPDAWFGPETTTVWMDGSCALKVTAARLVRDMVAPIMGFQHPRRSCVEDEAAVIIRGEMAPVDAVQTQVLAYRRAGFPVGVGPLTTTGVLARRPEAQPFNVCWETQIRAHTLRDQLSVDYSAWATGLTIGHWTGSYLQNPYMQYAKHGAGA